MTRITSFVAISALMLGSISPAIAQDEDDDDDDLASPFIDPNTGLSFSSSLSSTQIAALLASIALGAAVLVDGDGNVIATTTTP